MMLGVCRAVRLQRDYIGNILMLQKHNIGNPTYTYKEIRMIDSWDAL